MHVRSVVRSSSVPVGSLQSGPTRSSARAPRVVLYSHDTLGFGHLRRNLLIADAIRRSATAPEVLMVAGMREAGAFDLPDGVDCLTLPAYEKCADGQYRPRDLGQDLDPLVALRSQTILASVMAYAPHIMIVDNVPRGALAELDPVLQALTAQGGTRLILGLRDVIDRPTAVRRQWLKQRNFEALRKHYSDIWVYGDPALSDPVAEYGLGQEVRSRTRFTGYLDQCARLASPAAGPSRDAVIAGDRRPYILCAVGGGRDGAALCETFVQAPIPAGHCGILITGLQMPREARERLMRMAAQRDDLTVVEFVSEPIALMEGAARIVAMGGYNTVCEILSLHRPALIVPRVCPRAEQLMRAERLRELGLVDMLTPDDLTPGALGAWMAKPNPEAALRARNVLDFGGLDQVRKLIDAALNPAAGARPRLAV